MRRHRSGSVSGASGNGPQAGDGDAHDDSDYSSVGRGRRRGSVARVVGSDVHDGDDDDGWPQAGHHNPMLPATGQALRPPARESVDSTAASEFDHDAAAQSYETILVVSALLAGVAMSIPVDGHPWAQLVIHSVAVMNLMATLVLALMVFYILQLKVVTRCTRACAREVLVAVFRWRW